MEIGKISSVATVSIVVPKEKRSMGTIHLIASITMADANKRLGHFCAEMINQE
jgi:hypothetical protein